MVSRLRRRKKMDQRGVNAIFSGKGLRDKWDPELETSPSSNPTARSVELSRNKGEGSRVRVSRVFVALLLMGVGLTVIGNGFIVNDGSRQVSGSSWPGPRLPAISGSRLAPIFSSVSNVAEMLVSKNGSYRGPITTDVGDFLIVQVAYSEGSAGNLPDIFMVTDTLSSVYSKVASASPGVGANFWEQVWTGTASSSSTAANVTVTPDWTDCLDPCVSSIIVSMTIARYRDVSGLGASAIIASDVPSATQDARIAVVQSSSVLVELLSHGAYNNCGIDAAWPHSGQISRNCFTGTTERTEFFDHTVSGPLVYTESYSWSQVEVQRGIYLELEGNAAR